LLDSLLQEKKKSITVLTFLLFKFTEDAEISCQKFSEGWNEILWLLIG